MLLHNLQKLYKKKKKWLQDYFFSSYKQHGYLLCPKILLKTEQLHIAAV